jgi:altronate dehydratase
MRSWSLIRKKVIQIHPKDNVATAISAIRAGTLLWFSKGKKLKVKDPIPFGHKISFKRIIKGGDVIKYGEKIGRTLHEIGPGELVHIHNMVGRRGKSRSKNKGQRA